MSHKTLFRVFSTPVFGGNPMFIKRYFIIPVVALTILLSSCSSLFSSEEHTTPPPIAEPETFSYITEEVTLGTIASQVQKNGKFTTLLQYNLAFEKRGGYIKELNIELRKRVKAGELLASFDTVDIEKQVAEQSLTVQAARIDYDNAVKQVAAAAENYRRVEALTAIDRRNAEARLAEKRAAFEAGEITEIELAEAVSAYQHTIAALESNLAQARNAAESQADTKAQVTLKQAEMKLANLKEEFSKSVIRSPIDGIITFVDDIKIGSFVEARRPIVTVVDDSELILLVTDPLNTVSFYTEFAVGTPVAVKVMKEDYKGMVVFTPSDAPVNNILSDYQYILVDVYDIPVDLIALGTSATVSINTEVRDNVITVSSNAVQRYGDYAYVRVLKDGISVERPVELGMITSTRIEILNGLEIGEFVIIR